MPVPSYTDADFLAAMQSLLPTGPVWPREPDSVQAQTLAALAPTYTRQAARATNLLSDAFPVRPIELLPEWESTLGLPDPCAGAAPTQQQQQQQVAARFVASGGQTSAYFVKVAATLGFPIGITCYTPSVFGMSFGAPFGGDAWAHAWQITAPATVVEPFAFGRNAFGDAFATVEPSAVLQCEMQRIAPAHTTVFFSFF